MNAATDELFAELAGRVCIGPGDTWSHSEEDDDFVFLHVSRDTLRLMAEALSVRPLTLDEALKISAPITHRMVERDIARLIEAYPDAPGDADGE